MPMSYSFFIAGSNLACTSKHKKCTEGIVTDETRNKFQDDRIYLTLIGKRPLEKGAAAGKPEACYLKTTTNPADTNEDREWLEHICSFIRFSEEDLDEDEETLCYDFRVLTDEIIRTARHSQIREFFQMLCGVAELYQYCKETQHPFALNFKDLINSAYDAMKIRSAEMSSILKEANTRLATVHPRHYVMRTVCRKAKEAALSKKEGD